MRRLLMPFALLVLSMIGIVATACAQQSESSPTSPPQEKPTLKKSSAEKATPRKLNRLAKEKSPYLLQHAGNPVDWWPWGDEAFAEAKRRDVPVFVSIGYSTCHWCHVMEHESFEDDAIAAYMNANFVNVKLDREERPDVDAIYMQAVQMFTEGRGGWPASIWMTADRKPFWGGTYYRPPVFRRLLERVTELWKTQREGIIADADRTVQSIRSTVAVAAAKALPKKSLIAQAAASIYADYDTEYGGFMRRGPKFPRTSVHELMFLASVREKQPTWRDVALESLRKMCRGGIYDHVGGGFHRYSVDREWRVPHFEKMLYDQALITKTLIEAWQISGGEPFFADVVRDTLTCLRRDFLAKEEGAFISAYDADSGGEEGTYYIWTPKEFAQLLDEKTTQVIVTRFGVTEDGNWSEHRGHTVLEAVKTWTDVAQVTKLTEAECRKRWEASRPILRAARDRRPRPGADTKILTDWNGLTISAFARAGRVLDESTYVDTAVHAARFVLDRLRTDNGRLLHRYAGGDAAIDGVLTDYAYFIEGLLDLFEATGDVTWIDESVRLTDIVMVDFVGPAGGFFDASVRTKDIPVRLMDAYDGARPSGNSVMTRNLARLGDWTGDTKYATAAEVTLRMFAPRLNDAPRPYPTMLRALDAAHVGLREVLIVGEPKTSAALRRVVDTTYLPNAVVAFLAETQVKRAAKRLPVVAGKVAKNGATAYVCRAGACQAPTRDADVLTTQLRSR